MIGYPSPTFQVPSTEHWAMSRQPSPRWCELGSGTQAPPNALSS